MKIELSLIQLRRYITIYNVCFSLQLNYKTSNKFSMHDNRHAFQDHGVYFGDVSISSNINVIKNNNNMVNTETIHVPYQPLVQNMQQLW